jgi:alkylated DNA repair dioxygenase AlkB
MNGPSPIPRGTIPGVLYFEGFLRDQRAVFDWAVANVPWDERIKARKTASYGLPYNYKGLDYAYQPFPPELERVRVLAGPKIGIDANNCLLNYYPDGWSRMGFHADAVEGLTGGVAIVSLGAERALRFRRIARLEERLDYMLAPGSLLYLPQAVHREWHHALPRTSRPDPRISLTFRAITQSA